jgi:hypothetical protein
VHSKKRYCIAIAMSISCLFVSTCLNIYYYLRNERNESYLNETMTRSIKSMSSSIVNAEVMLSFVVDNKTITREQTDELYFQYHEFSYSIRELEELYIKVRGEQRLFNSANEYHLEIYQFFEHLRVEMDKNIQTVRKLNDDEINYYNEMLNISKCCSNILQKYRNKRLFVKEDEWIKLLKTLSTVDGKETKNNNSLKV